MMEAAVTKQVNKKYLTSTQILDFDHPLLQQLVEDRKWLILSDTDKVREIYNFVRDEIQFGYNISDNVTASSILQDGYGQCNTKATLLMALLRAVGIPNRIHGFTINKALQKGAVTGVWYRLTPKNILHSWVEVLIDETWYYLEGVILDMPYLNALQAKNKDSLTFCGFGAFTDNLQKPAVEFNLNHTFIQEKGINQDFGLFDTPDEFYAKHRQKFGAIKKFMFQNYVRFVMNKNIDKIRNSNQN